MFRKLFLTIVFLLGMVACAPTQTIVILETEDDKVEKYEAPLIGKANYVRQVVSAVPENLIWVDVPPSKSLIQQGDTLISGRLNIFQDGNQVFIGCPGESDNLTIWRSESSGRGYWLFGNSVNWEKYDTTGKVFLLGFKGKDTVYFRVVDEIPQVAPNSNTR